MHCTSIDSITSVRVYMFKSHSKVHKARFGAGRNSQYDMPSRKVRKQREYRNNLVKSIVRWFSQKMTTGIFVHFRSASCWLRTNDDDKKITTEPNLFKIMTEQFSSRQLNWPNWKLGGNDEWMGIEMHPICVTFISNWQRNEFFDIFFMHSMPSAGLYYQRKGGKQLCSDFEAIDEWEISKTINTN